MGSSATGVGGSGRLEARVHSKVTASTTQHPLITVMKEYRQTQGCQDLEQNPSFRRHISLVYFPPSLPNPPKTLGKKIMSENQLWSAGLGWPEDHQLVTSDLRWLLASIIFQKRVMLYRQANSHGIEAVFQTARKTFHSYHMGRQLFSITM